MNIHVTMAKAYESIHKSIMCLDVSVIHKRISERLKANGFDAIFYPQEDKPNALFWDVTSKSGADFRILIVKSDQPTIIVPNEIMSEIAECLRG